jgi:ribosome-associated heat shock protein Hsp15
MSESMRIDKWLWVVRFFKTRTLATAAVSGGKVHLNGARVKPGKDVQIGDMLEVSRGESIYRVEVLQLLKQRGSAPVAQACYLETEESRAKREALLAQRRDENLGQGQRVGRPNKRERRQLSQFKR